jgi:hypothetical protein
MGFGTRNLSEVLKMNLELMIVDNFYTDPNLVRKHALSQTFDVKGNFPGARTKPFLPDDVKSGIQYWMSFAGKITEWFEDQGHTGAFQIATSLDRTWIHADHYNMWAGVCYLTPDAPYTGGTGLYRHKSSGEFKRSNKDYEGYDYTKWDLFDRIGNKYNRLILYRGDLFHASLDYFGSNQEDGRLFQTFFFNTERY